MKHLGSLLRDRGIGGRLGRRASSEKVNTGSQIGASVLSVFMRGALWNTGGFLAGTGLRFVTNVALARMLTPDLFGTMTIVNTIRTGMELVSDFGGGQNIVSSRNAENPGFYNTVFTFQAIRGALLWLALCAAAQPIAALYNLPDLVWIMPVTGLATLIGGLTSPAREFMRKRLRFRELGVNEIVVSTLISLEVIVIATISPTIWALVIGGVIGAALTTLATYFLRAGLQLKFEIRREFAPEILHYGKWIVLSSLAYFSATYYDRLFFAKTVPLGVLGVYGISRSIADLMWAFAARMGANILFPYIASAMRAPRATLRRDLSPIRLRFLTLCAFGLAVLIVGSDLMIRHLYDRRYHDAIWLLPVLVLGAWFSILANINESALLGLGKPSYGAVSNLVKLMFLVVGLPVALRFEGLLGATLLVALADVPKLLTLWVGQEREQFSFARQDAAATLIMFALVAALESVRWSLGFGTSFDTLPSIAFTR